MKKHSLFLIILVLPFLSFAQNTPPSNEELRQRANHSFVVLKENVLLVRLKSNIKKINALKEYGYVVESKEFQNLKDVENREIVKSFKDEFSFCDTYFFFSENSNLVRAKDFSEPIFLDENLKIDPSVVLPTDSFLIAEFGHVMSDPGPYKDFYISDPEDGFNKRTSYWAGPNLRFGALIIMNNQFVQIRRPFPRYARTFDSLPFLKRSIVNTVARLNKKLFKYEDSYISEFNYSGSSLKLNR